MTLGSVGMRRGIVTLSVIAGVGIGAQGLASGAATKQCRTVYARGTDTSNPSGRVVAHVCDRIEIDFVIGTQGEIVPDWNVSRRPAKKIAKFVSKRYGPAASSDEGTERFIFQAVGRGRTWVGFRETTPSPGYGTLDTARVDITVQARRK